MKQKINLSDNEKPINENYMQNWLVLIPHSLNKRMRKHIDKNGYESMGSFIRTAIFTQLDEEKPIDFPLPKRRQKMICFQVPNDLQSDIDDSTAKTNYSSRSDFVRACIRNQMARDETGGERLE